MYSVKDGWDPLCKFLDLPVPDKDFPHENKKGEITQKMLTTHPLLLKVQREALLSMSLMILFLGYTTYNIATKPKADSILGLPGRLCRKVLDYFGYQLTLKL